MNTSHNTHTAWWRRALSRMSRDLEYLLTTLPLAIASFTALITMFVFSLSTAIIWAGVPAGAATLLVASWFAKVERTRLATISDDAPTAEYSVAPASASAVKRLLHPYRDPQRWRDLLYAILDFPVAVTIWAVSVMWTAAAVLGSTSWIWSRWVPETPDTSMPIVDWLNSAGGQTVLGVFALVTLPLVARALAGIQQGMGLALLGSSDAQRLRAEVSRLELRGKAAASAETQSLRRIERDLHDGPQQRLIRLAMDVQEAERNLDKNPEAARQAMSSVREQSASALAELRHLTRGIAPPILTERGLRAALESLAERGTVPVTVDVNVARELTVAAETTLYFVASEALANVSKHADATEAKVTVADTDNRITLTVLDDGVGGAHPAKGHGLAGLIDRVEGVGGTLTFADAPGGGTIVTAEVPCG